MMADAFTQIIIHVPFTQAIRLRAILLKAARGEFSPGRLRVYANFANIVDFADAENTRPHLDISLLEETAVTEYPLRVAAFTNVNSLSLFFVSSFIRPWRLLRVDLSFLFR